MTGQDSSDPVAVPRPPVRLVLVGAGHMGREWIRTIAAEPLTTLVGVVDLDLPLAEKALADAGMDWVVTGTSVAQVAALTGADAVVNVTVPGAHHAVNTEAMVAGLPVLCEKPVTPTVAQALSLAATSEVTGQLLMVSQSRRYFNALRSFRDESAKLGPIGIAHTTFHKAAHFDGFRRTMPHVLLVDMAIHAFDTARYVLGSDPVSASCSTWNPSWSWYAGDASATALFAMADGSRYSYTGSWCAPGAETSWNGAWRVSAERGSALWDGEHDPELHADGVTATERPASPYSDIAGALQVFCEALRTGEAPMGEVHENVMSLAMVEAAVESAAAGSPVLLDDVLARAHAHALADEADPGVRAALAGWTSVRDALAAPAARVAAG